MLDRLRWLAIAGLNAVLFGTALALIAPGPSSSPARKSDGPAQLRLAWVRELPPLEPTWPDQPKFTSDSARQPVVSGQLLFLACSRSDSLLALNAATGATAWRFTADGPIRFAPAVWDDRVFVTSDDGHLYCLEKSTGKRLWSFRGGPGDRRLLGNERLISTWPARGAPVVASEGKAGGTVYFAAGIWPFMGIFLHALDAKTGAVRWSNSGDGAIFIKQPHNTDAFAGIAPQGSLVVDGDKLFVPGGRSIPACYDRHTGKLLHYRLADNSKKGGGPDLLASEGMILNGNAVFDQEKGNYLGPIGEPASLRGACLFSVSGSTCRVFDLHARPEPASSAKGKKAAATETWLGEAEARIAVPKSTVLLPTETRLYGAGPGKVYSLALPIKSDKPHPVFEASLSGTPIHLTANGERLFVSTREGRIYAFAETKTPARRQGIEVKSLPPADRERVALCKSILAATDAREGYAVLLGAGSGGLVSELLRNSKLRLLVLEPDADKAAALRERLISANIDFKRCAVLSKTLAEAELPPYFCTLVTSESLAGFDVDEAFCSALFRSMRPYGGTASLMLDKAGTDVLEAWRKKEPTAALKVAGKHTLLSRPGALPGAGNWTHQHADAANTRVSPDKLVKAPLGLLWFGGPGNQDILPRHGHGPVPQAVDGRLFIEGVDLLRAVDVYTGRLMWEAKLPGLGGAYNNLAHQAGANATGSNYVSLSDGIFVAHEKRCVKLDPATGKQVAKYELPPLKGEKTSPPWTFLAVEGKYLIAGANATPNKQPGKDKKGARTAFRGQESSNRLSVLDRASGKVLWSATAEQGWRHNAICSGNGRLYAIDRPASVLIAKKVKAKEKDKSKDKSKEQDKEQEKNDSTEAKELPARLVCFELATGKELWASKDEVFGTWLSYSSAHDVLVEAGLMSRDTLVDEAPGMRAFQGERGGVLWHRKDFFGPALIHGERILKGGDARGGSGTACELKTGKPIQDRDPLTGADREWRWSRTYGCNTPAACENLMLFRSGAAGFFDLTSDGGTGNFGGFRSSCTMNLIASGGVLTIPDYTRTCTCSYQQQTSVGLIHTPDVEMWTFSTSKQTAGVVQRVGINLGAPGSRKADNGTLWVEYPIAGGPAPRLALDTVPPKPATFRMHSSKVSGTGQSWVAASGARDLQRLSIPLVPDGSAARKYTVRLVFLEPDGLGEGKRVFDVSIQGEQAIRKLDVSKEAGGPGRGLVRELKGVLVKRELMIALTPMEGSAGAVLSGVEAIAE